MHTASVVLNYERGIEQAYSDSVILRLCLIRWGAVSDLSLISDLSQKFKHDLRRVKSELKLSQKQHLTPEPKPVSKS